MSKKVRTIAFQVDDLDFIRQYEQRVRDSGMSVKNYFVSLIKADIALHQTQLEHPAQDEDIETIQSEQLQPTDEPVLEQDANEFSEDAAGNNITDEFTEHQEQDEESEQLSTAVPAEDEETMNLFVKIPKEQRKALESHKNETGETVGNVLNRIIDDFLNQTDSLPDGFEEAYQQYSANVKSCDTTCSAKIPTRVNQELTDYLNSFSGSRNALMATLVDLELEGQEMLQEQAGNQGISMQ